VIIKDFPTPQGEHEQRMEQLRRIRKVCRSWQVLVDMQRNRQMLAVLLFLGYVVPALGAGGNPNSMNMKARAILVGCGCLAAKMGAKAIRMGYWAVDMRQLCGQPCEKCEKTCARDQGHPGYCDCGFHRGARSKGLVASQTTHAGRPTSRVGSRLWKGLVIALLISILMRTCATPTTRESQWNDGKQ